MGIGLNLCLADVHIALAKHGVVVELSYFPFERAWLVWYRYGIRVLPFGIGELGNWGRGDGMGMRKRIIHRTHPHHHRVITCLLFV